MPGGLSGNDVIRESSSWLRDSIETPIGEAASLPGLPRWLLPIADSGSTKTSHRELGADNKLQ
jgi:hypothetical protein